MVAEIKSEIIIIIEIKSEIIMNKVLATVCLPPWRNSPSSLIIIAAAAVAAATVSFWLVYYPTCLASYRTSSVVA
jgi:hypothetical protein